MKAKSQEVEMKREKSFLISHIADCKGYMSQFVEYYLKKESSEKERNKRIHKSKRKRSGCYSCGLVSNALM